MSGGGTAGFGASQPPAIDWNMIISPTTFERVYTLRIRGRYTGIEISREKLEDKSFNENEFMLRLLNDDRITTDDCADALSQLKQRLLNI